MSEQPKINYEKWTQNGLLSIIAILMVWFMTDNSTFKRDVMIELKAINITQSEQFLDQVRKNAKQDLLIDQNRSGIDKQHESIGELKEDNEKIKKKVGIF